MSAPAGPPPFLDPANPLLAQVPLRWDAGMIELPGGAGKTGVLTFRTASTTLTGFLGAEDLGKLGAFVTNLGREVSGSGLVLPTAVETITLGNGNRRPGVG